MTFQGMSPSLGIADGRFRRLRLWHFWSSIWSSKGETG
jgi:hypothetical protein